MTNPKLTSIESYGYALPQDRIASHPLSERDSCKLLFLDAEGNISDHIFKDLPDLLPDNSMLVCNDTRVIHARLRFRRATGAAIEIFCLEPESPADYAVNFASTGPVRWKCLVGNAKKWKDKEVLSISLPDGRQLSAKTVSRGDTSFTVEFSWDSPALTFSDVISLLGEIPIPPYLNRRSEKCDETDYQTVYAEHKGSVAAPTAGLHFTDNIFSRLREKGIPCHKVTLHVGAGTFRPVKSETLAGHDMHAEFISVSADLIKELAVTTRKIYAVGTTTVRTLESLYIAGCMVAKGLNPCEIPQWLAYSSELPCLPRKDALLSLVSWLENNNLPEFTADTRIIITPPYVYKVVDGLITNFHQPRSTLLLLVAAMIGDKWKEVYDHALGSGYRFLSYGDACLFEKP